MRLSPSIERLPLSQFSEPDLPLRKLIRSKATKSFLTQDGTWTNDIASAAVFGDRSAAVGARDQFHLEEVELYYSVDYPRQSQVGLHDEPLTPLQPEKGSGKGSNRRSTNSIHQIEAAANSSVTASKLSYVDNQALTKARPQKSLTKSCHCSDKIIVFESEPLACQLLTANTVFPFVLSII